jgi:PIN domain-containing protein
MRAVLAVLPDTNALFGMLTSRSPEPAWQRLLGLSTAGEIEVVLAEVVQWELANQLREKLDSELGSLRVQTEKLRGLGLEPPAFGEGPDQVPQLVASASEHLRQAVLWHRGRIAPAPFVAAADLVRRSLERRPPFDRDDRGLRDTMLWLTALDVLATGATVILVSQDKRAFGDGELLGALREEVAASCGDGNRVLLTPDCPHALELVRERTSEVRRAAERAFDDPDVLAGAMHALADEARGEILDDRALSRQGWPAELVGVRVVHVERFTSAAIQSVDRTPDGSMRVGVRVGVVAELDARHDPELEYNDFMELIHDAEVNEIGYGLIDPLVQAHLRRTADLFGEVLLDPRADVGPLSRLTRVELPRRTLPHGQLRLELP